MKNQKKGILFGFVLALVLMCGISMVRPRPTGTNP